MRSATVATDAGVFLARYSDKGLVSLDFPSAAKSRSSEAPTAEIQGWHQLTSAALERLLSGKAPRALPPLDWSGASEFHRRVWTVLLAIPPGQTRSYGQIAAELGDVSGARAVGSACGANPIPVLVPCHRVLAQNGQLGGFSAGLHWKRILLEREGALLPLQSGKLKG